MEDYYFIILINWGLFGLFINLKVGVFILGIVNNGYG